MIGMFIPSMLVVSLAVTPGAAEPSVANMPVYAAVELGSPCWRPNLPITSDPGMMWVGGRSAVPLIQC